MNLRLTAASLILGLAHAVSAEEPIRYTVRFPAPHTHYAEVTASLPVPKAGPRSLEVFMAVWTPGSYLVREYARHVDDFAAATPDGHALAWSKTRKNRWRIETAGASRVELRYRVYARQMSVQGNWVDASFAMLNGAPMFVTPVGNLKRPYEVRLELPAAWKKSLSGLPAGSEPHSYRAADFDELLDSPIYAGNAPIHEFEVDGKKHSLVNEGEGPMWDGPASARDVAKIVAEFSRQWGGLPYEKYVFFNLITESGGGLEHRNSTWMGASRWAYANTQAPDDDPDGAESRRRKPSRQGWLGLVSHEYFHLWNVKRLRPVELGPFDFENEVYSRSLWLAEGVTSYYGPLGLKRAGLIDRKQFLRTTSRAIRELQTTPGRLALPLESASYDAWIRSYRADENTPNTSISYYTKGQVVGFLLDARIRQASGGQRSLDDAMNTAFARHGGARGYEPAEFRQIVSEVAGVDLGLWMARALETTAELDYSEALDWYGLRFRSEPRKPDAPEKRFRTGITTRNDSGRTVITGLRRDTAGYDAGFNAEDEILAINGYRVRADQWPARLQTCAVGDTVEVLVARRDELITLKLPLVADPPPAWSLEVRADATDEQKARLQAWIGE